METDLLDPLNLAIEEFHRLRDESRRLMEQARWPQVKDQDQEAPGEPFLQDVHAGTRK